MPSYQTILTVIYVLLVMGAFFAILRERGDPTKALAWMLVIVAIPVLGLLVYGLLGISYRKNKLLSREIFTQSEAISALIRKDTLTIEAYRKQSGLTNKPLEQIAQLIAKTNQFLPTLHNKADILIDGEAKFAALFADLEKAQHHIHVEYFILFDDKVGLKLQDVLIRKAKAGVLVRLIYDGMGSISLGRAYVQALKRAGVEVYSFLPLQLRIFKRNRINYRCHRKIVVIDGMVGFTGGINVADYYIEGNKKVGKWHDTHLRLEGEVVKWLQIVFLVDWHFVSKQVINDVAYFPPATVTDRCIAQVVACGPDSDWETVQMAYFAAINAAKNHLYVVTPYFVPDDSLMTALRTSALRGIDVRVLLPVRSDSWIPHYASLSFVEALLLAGIRVYQYSPGMVHSKLLMIDGEWCSIGTANMDIRSLSLNFEINALLYDEPTTQRLEQAFLDDLTLSHELTLDAWQQRGRWKPFAESIARLPASLL